MKPGDLYAEEIRLRLAAELTERLRARGWSANELARRAGVSAPMIRNIERGRMSPTLDFISRLCPALGVRLGELIGAADQRRVGRQGAPPANYNLLCLCTLIVMQ